MITDVSSTAVPREPAVERPSSALRLLLSGGGLRAMIGSIGVSVYLMVSGEWKHVTEIISVSGGSPPNAVLLDGDESIYTGEAAHDDHIDLGRLQGLYQRLVHDAAKPHRTARRVFWSLAFVGLLGALLALCLFATGLLPSSEPARPWMAILVGVGLVPIGIQVGRRIASRYFRDILDTISSTQRDRLLADAHRTARPGRQHVFCASGITSGAPYYFWAGGKSFLGKKTGADVGWGSEISPLSIANYRVGDAVFASSSLPFIGGIVSPTHSNDPTADLPKVSEPLVDGGASGVFGQQVRDPFWRPTKDRVTQGTATPWQAPSVIAVDSYRHQAEVQGGLVARAMAMVRDRGSSLFLLVRWLKISGEALYVNDLLDAQRTTLVRLCEFDMPAPEFDPSKTAWREAWHELCQLRRRDSDIETAGVGDPLSDLRARTASIGLLGMNNEKALNALTTGFVAAYVAREPVFDPYALRQALRAGDKLFFGHAEDAPSMETLWADIGATHGIELVDDF